MVLVVAILLPYVIGYLCLHSGYSVLKIAVDRI